MARKINQKPTLLSKIVSFFIIKYRIAMLEVHLKISIFQWINFYDQSNVQSIVIAFKILIIICTIVNSSQTYRFESIGFFFIHNTHIHIYSHMSHSYDFIEWFHSKIGLNVQFAITFDETNHSKALIFPFDL